MHVRVKQAAPFEHRQALRPSVAYECVRELKSSEKMVVRNPDADAGVSRWSVVTPLHLRADRSSMHRAESPRCRAHLGPSIQQVLTPIIRLIAPAGRRARARLRLHPNRGCARGSGNLRIYSTATINFFE